MAYKFQFGAATMSGALTQEGALTAEGLASLDGGIDVIGKGTDYGHKMKDEYTYNNYHALSDEVKDDWDYSGMVEDGRILFRVGYAASQHSKWPEWSEGTEFKSKREESLKSYKY